MEKFLYDFIIAENRKKDPKQLLREQNYDRIQAIMKSFSLFGVRIDDVSEEQVKELLHGWLRGNGQHLVVTPNPEIVLAAKNHVTFRALLNQSALAVPDGVGLTYAIPALTSSRLEHRHAGVDVFLLLAEACAREGKRLLLVGGRPEAGRRSAAVLRKVYPGLEVSSFDPGIVSGTVGTMRMKKEILEAVQALHPDVMAVALGQGKQEQFAAMMLEYIPSLKIAIGVGGTFEIVGGLLARAPESMRRAGFEWLWRLYLEPARAGRIFRASILFPVLVAWDTLKRRRFITACRQVFPEVVRQMKHL